MVLQNGLNVICPRECLMYTYNMVQAVNCDLLLYADDTGLIFPHKDIKIIEH